MGDSDVYTAERIVGKKTENGATLYCIKWKGYASRYNSWEPVENILDRGLLTAFERKEAQKVKRTPTNSSRNRSNSKKDLDDRETSSNNPPATTSKRDTPEPTPVPTPVPVSVPTPIPTPTPTPVPASVQASVPTPVPSPPPSSPTSNGHSIKQSPPSTSVVSKPVPSPNEVSAYSSIVTTDKSRRIASRYTVITDVTVNDQTITICESKINQGFFKEIARHSVAVDTTQMVE